MQCRESWGGALFPPFTLELQMTAALEQTNDNLVLIGGVSGAGKSACLRNLRNQEGVLYLNCESGKKLPFRNKFISKTITEPDQIFEGFQWAETQPQIHTIVIDSVSFLMDMFVSTRIINSADSRSQWQAYAEYFKQLMQQYVASSTKNVIMITHIQEDVDEEKGIRTESAVIKGGLKGTGVEAYFSLNVTARAMPVKELDKFPSEFLNITEDERDVGYKHVFQVRKTKETTGSKIRGPMGLFDNKTVYIDNDAQLLLDVVHEFYKDE